MSVPVVGGVSAAGLLALPEADLAARADTTCRRVFGDSVYLRGLIEATNCCVRNCAYCGIRRGNGKVGRYRLSDEEILSAAEAGHAKGLRSFVLQGAEDPEFDAERLARLAAVLRERLGAGVALTFSFGTMRKSEYALLGRAGADRYLIRFETSDPSLHRALRGSPLSQRLRAIEDLRELGFEVGTGFMTGLPGIGEAALEGDLDLAARLAPDMIGVGPFIPHPETPLAAAESAGLGLALRAVAALRVLLPEANIPATTAAGSIAPDGRERMLSVGANVLMPNIGPVARKKDYELYPGKICLDEDGLHCIGCLSLRVAGVGKRIDWSRGDSPSFARKAS